VVYELGFTAFVNHVFGKPGLQYSRSPNVALDSLELYCDPSQHPRTLLVGETYMAVWAASYQRVLM
jgi:hypothetical protein